jgi:hypothetical protein
VPRNLPSPPSDDTLRKLKHGTTGKGGAPKAKGGEGEERVLHLPHPSQGLFFFLSR